MEFKVAQVSSFLAFLVGSIMGGILSSIVFIIMTYIAMRSALELMGIL